MLQAERQKVLLAHERLCGRPAGDARCLKSESVFQSKWWGRKLPLEPDPRKLIGSRGSHALDNPMDGLSIDGDLHECAPCLLQLLFGVKRRLINYCAAASACHAHVICRHACRHASVQTVYRHVSVPAQSR